MMSTRTVNLDTYSLSLLTAKEDIINPRSSINWALFVYDGISNKLRLADSGAGGVAELASKFHISKPQYGLCRLGSPESGSPRTAMIIWMGRDVDDYKRTECASHIPAIKNFFKEVHVFLQAENAEEVTEERIRAELSKAHTSASSQWLRRSSQSSMDRKDIVVGFMLHHQDPLEGDNDCLAQTTEKPMLRWRCDCKQGFFLGEGRARRGGAKRGGEKRAAEERRRLERERALKERQEADERDRKMNEKLQMIEEQRRKAAEQEEEERRKEKLKWEQQQREHEEEMRARLKRRESIEKAAEAAALVSQRTMNPREFFRQLSSSSSQSPTSPSRSGKPFRRYQRSLTDTAFIFSKAEESSSSSPCHSPLVSPFSRAPPSPFNRATSPPTSQSFTHPPLHKEPANPHPCHPYVLPHHLLPFPASHWPTSSYKVQTVLVEEDEEEAEEDVKEKEDTQPKTEAQTDPEEPEVENENQTQTEQEEVIKTKEVKEETSEHETLTVPEVTSAVEEQVQTEERLKEEDLDEATKNTEDTDEIPAEVKQEHLEIKCLTPESAINVITNGNSQEHNGTDHSLSPSDPELDSPELAVYCTVQDDDEDDICIQKYITISENGDEDLAEPQMCVRALYDYQAEDESELSFELGDIIRDVEAVDKGWWRGWSQDGRQGLFPANYVETISPQ
ncbi:hypothetical protein WMY93_004625 [Mugilogobius chulae]|uniref:Uncharacterized protein n=1 Tax=Mugilogobius chulae TaxID=88201 RepID=A0AAW0PPI1_9GOBI